MSTYVSTVKGLPEYDFANVRKPEICETIIKECESNASFERIKALASFAAGIALAYFAYLAAASFISTYGILAAGVTVIAVVAYLLPVAVIVAVPFIFTVGYGVVCWNNANHYKTQAHLAQLRKAELL